MTRDIHIEGNSITVKVNPRLVEAIRLGNRELEKKRDEWWALSARERRDAGEPPSPVSALDYVPGEVTIIAKALGYGYLGSCTGPDSEGNVTYYFRGC